MRPYSQEKRLAILQAAFSEVSERGYFETKVDDIARRAGVAKGTVYLYFRDKPEIYLGLVDWLLCRALGIVSEIDARPLAPEKKLQQVFTEWAEHVFTRPGILTLVSLEHINVPEDAVKRFHRAILPRLRQMVEAVARIIRPGIKSGIFRRVDARLAALGFLQAFRTSIIAHRHDIGLRGRTTEVLDLFLSGLMARTKE